MIYRVMREDKGVWSKYLIMVHTHDNEHLALVITYSLPKLWEYIYLNPPQHIQCA